MRNIDADLIGCCFPDNRVVRLGRSRGLAHSVSTEYSHKISCAMIHNIHYLLGINRDGKLNYLEGLM